MSNNKSVEQRVHELYDNVRNLPNQDSPDVNSPRAYFNLLSSKVGDRISFGSQEVKGRESSFRLGISGSFLSSERLSPSERLRAYQNYILPLYEASGLEGFAKQGSVQESRACNNLLSSVIYVNTGETELVIRSPKFGYFPLLGNRVIGRIRRV